MTTSNVSFPTATNIYESGVTSDFMCNHASKHLWINQYSQYFYFQNTDIVSKVFLIIIFHCSETSIHSSIIFMKDSGSKHILKAYSVRKP